MNYWSQWSKEEIIGDNQHDYEDEEYDDDYELEKNQGCYCLCGCDNCLL